MSLLAFRSRACTAAEESVENQLRGLLARLTPSKLPVERRQNGRYPFPHLVQLTPVDRKTLAPLGPPIVVVGKELSLRGLGFFHQFPLSYRRASVAFEDAEGRRLCLLIDLSWCRFTRHGWYESGGRFLQVLSSLGESTPPPAGPEPAEAASTPQDSASGQSSPEEELPILALPH